MIRTIHPFPARMAPELALETLNDLAANSVVLDPMSGSGTVIRQAAEMGHRPIGFDMDPLAVLMSQVWTK
jgi:DNA modification methylase